MPRKYPPLTLQEVVEIMKFNGFVKDRQKGSHHQYVKQVGKKKFVVTVDVGKSPYGDFLIKSMISQTGLSRKKFYCSCKSAAIKINEKYQKVAPANS